MKSKVLITGGSGLLGANLALQLRDHYTVTATFREHRVSIPGIECIPLDICCNSSVQECLYRYRPDTIIHCAAETRVDYCEQHSEQAYRVNQYATRLLALAAARMNCCFVYISTDSIYKEKGGMSQETDLLEPVNSYGKSKLAGEGEVIATCDNYLILRTNMYGWNVQDKLSLAEWVVLQLRTGKMVPGLCDCIFSPLLVNQLSVLIDRLLQIKATGVFNLGSCDTCSKYEFAQMVCQVFNYPLSRVKSATMAELDFIAKRSGNTSLNIAKVQAVLGQPLPTIFEGITQFFQLLQSGYVVQLKQCF